MNWVVRVLTVGSAVNPQRLSCRIDEAGTKLALEKHQTSKNQ
jgi:hypothetical protein